MDPSTAARDPATYSCPWICEEFRMIFHNFPHCFLYISLFYGKYFRLWDRNEWRYMNQPLTKCWLLKLTTCWLRYIRLFPDFQEKCGNVVGKQAELNLTEIQERSVGHFESNYKLSRNSFGNHLFWIIRVIPFDSLQLTNQLQNLQRGRAC